MLTEKLVKLSREKPLFPAFVFGFLIVMPLIVLLIFARPSQKKLEEADVDYRDIILFTFDTLRSDKIGCYGSSRARTPNFDKFSRKSVLFHSAFTDAPETVPAHATLMTGRHAYKHNCLDNRYPLPLTEDTLAEILAEKGYRTIAVTNALLRLGRGLEQGFNLFNGTNPSSLDNKLATGDWGHQPKRLTNDKNMKRDPLRAEVTVKRILSEEVFSQRSPVFLWAHFWDTHIFHIRHLKFFGKLLG